MLRLAPLLIVVLASASCGDGSRQTAGSPPPAERSTPAEVSAPGEAARTAEQARPAAAPGDEVHRCGVGGTTRPERLACATDADCVLSAFDHTSCHEDACGLPRHAYNKAFAARVAAECAASTCDDGTRGILAACGSPGGSIPYRAACVGGFCEARLAGAP